MVSDNVMLVWLLSVEIRRPGSIGEFSEVYTRIVAPDKETAIRMAAIDARAHGWETRAGHVMGATLTDVPVSCVLEGFLNASEASNG